MAKFKLNKTEAKLLLAYVAYTAKCPTAYGLLRKLEDAGVTSYPTLLFDTDEDSNTFIEVNEDEEDSL